MLDYTFNGVPTSKMPDADLNEILADGDLVVLDSDGTPEAEAKARILDRLSIERLRRDLGLPIR